MNAAIALFALALVEVATPDDFGWYAYAPLDEVLEKDPRFPWHYVVVPLALLLMNVVVVRAYLVRTVHKHKHK
jgi:heme/copper-type cytochrome/quinol oxidase subunit 1